MRPETELSTLEDAAPALNSILQKRQMIDKCPADESHILERNCHAESEDNVNDIGVYNAGVGSQTV